MKDVEGSKKFKKAGNLYLPQDNSENSKNSSIVRYDYDSQYYNSQLEIAKTQQEIRKTIRKGNLEAIQDYIVFTTKNTAGLSALVGGTLEALFPSILPITLANPGITISVGLALLAGKSTVDIIKKIVDSFDSES